MVGVKYISYLTRYKNTLKVITETDLYPAVHGTDHRVIIPNRGSMFAFQ